MIYECIVERGANGFYYLKLEDGNKLSWDEVKPLLYTENGEKKENDRFIMYSIKGIDKNWADKNEADKNEVSSTYRLRVRKDHINAYKDFIEDVESRWFKQEKNSIFKRINFRKINWKRLAIIGLSVVLVASTPAVIKASKDALNEDNEDWINRNSAPSYAYDNPSLNPELDKYNEYVKSIQKEELEKEKYHILFVQALDGNDEARKNLRDDALLGNEVARSEYSNYLSETSPEKNQSKSK